MYLTYIVWPSQSAVKQLTHQQYHQTLPSSQYGIPMLRIPSWIAHWNINPETPLGKYSDKNHHHCAPFNINPVIPSLGKLGENPQKKTISLPPFLCKQVEVWIHYKSIIVLSYNSASKPMMKLHQNESWLLAGRSESFHSFPYMLFNYNLSTQRWLQQFRYTMCVHRPARFVGIHIQINCFVYTSKSQEGVNSCFQGKQCCVHRNFAPY